MRFLSVLNIVGFLLCTGCGQEIGPQRLQVQGTATLRDGTPIVGAITFLPDGPGPAANGAIREGQFLLPQAEGPTAGSHRVLISLAPGKMASDFKKPSAQSSSRKVRWEFPVTVSPSETEFEFELSD